MRTPIALLNEPFFVGRATTGLERVERLIHLLWVNAIFDQQLDSLEEPLVGGVVQRVVATLRRELTAQGKIGHQSTHCNSTVSAHHAVHTLEYDIAGLH